MQYGGMEDEAVYMNIRKVRKHDEPDEDEKAQLERVRCFMKKMKWTAIEEEDDETVGITWLELYIYYAIHGGCKEIIRVKLKNVVKGSDTANRYRKV